MGGLLIRQRNRFNWKTPQCACFLPQMDSKRTRKTFICASELCDVLQPGTRQLPVYIILQPQLKCSVHDANVSPPVHLSFAFFIQPHTPGGRLDRVGAEEPSLPLAEMAPKWESIQVCLTRFSSGWTSASCATAVCINLSVSKCSTCVLSQIIISNFKVLCTVYYFLF